MPPDLQRQHTLTDGCSTALGFVHVRVCARACVWHCILCVGGVCERNGTDEKNHMRPGPWVGGRHNAYHTGKRLGKTMVSSNKQETNDEWIELFNWAKQSWFYFYVFSHLFECLRLKYKGFNREKCVKTFLDWIFSCWCVNWRVLLVLCLTTICCYKTAENCLWHPHWIV